MAVEPPVFLIEREREYQTLETMKAATMEDAVVKGTERIDPKTPQLEPFRPNERRSQMFMFA